MQKSDIFFYVKSTINDDRGNPDRPNFGGYDALPQVNDRRYENINYKVVFALRYGEGEETIFRKVNVFVFSFYDDHKEALNLATEFMKKTFMKEGKNSTFEFVSLTSLEDWFNL